MTDSEQCDYGFAHSMNEPEIVMEPMECNQMLTAEKDGECKRRKKTP